MGLLDSLKRKKTTSTDEKAVVAPVAKTEKAAVAPVKKAAVKKEKKPASVAKIEALPKKPLQALTLLHPILTEKSLKLQAMNQYVFAVRTDANKSQVVEAIKQTYGVKPLAVRIVNIPPTVLSRWGRNTGMKKAIKKAIVSVAPGTTLELNRK